MERYCLVCGSPHTENEPTCPKCGATYGGKASDLIVGLLIAIALPAMLAFKGNTDALRDARLYLWYVLPVLVGTAIVYDHDPRRAKLYILGAAPIIAASMLLLGR